MNKHSQNSLRIIGGEWRGRKLGFAKVEAIRPTPDRVRETLFNWLAPMIRGANCLDLFSGSGALGFEALSRGAESAVMCDTNPKIISTLKEHAALLKTTKGTFLQADAISYLNRNTQKFDLVFLDPPFDSDLLKNCFDVLATKDCLNHGAMIYVEMNSKADLPEVPANWVLHRDKIAGGVAYSLFIME